MCGRFDDFADARTLAREYKANTDKVKDWMPHYNVAPTQRVPVLFDDGEREFDFARFGMRPSWWKHAGREFINVRSETFREKPFFRRQLETHRCVLPVTGFYEWKRSGTGKTPYRFAPGDPDGLFSLACVWEIDTIRGTEQLTFAIVTGPPNALMRPVHDRMPVVLRPDGVDAWLDPATKTPELFALMKPPASGSMRAYVVSRDVNNPNNDAPYLIEPAG